MLSAFLEVILTFFNVAYYYIIFTAISTVVVTTIACFIHYRLTQVLIVCLCFLCFPFIIPAMIITKRKGKAYTF